MNANAAIADRIRVIDADAHVSEPPDLWTSRLASKWQDVAPNVQQLNTSPGGAPEDVWFIGGRPIVPAWISASAGWHEFYPGHPPLQSDAQPAAWDAKERVLVMDDHGIAMQVLYPNLLAFYQIAFLEISPEFALDAVRSYNDFLTEFCAVAPGRFIPIATLPFWDVEASVREIERCAEVGHRGVLFINAPEKAGQPVLRDLHWDRLFSAAQECQMSVNFHVAAGTADPALLAAMAPGGEFVQSHADTAKQTTLGLLSNSAAIVEVIFSGLCERYPNLDFVSVESGFGYIPYLVETMDWQWHNNGAAAEFPNRLKPSEYFRRQVYATFWFERESLGRLVDLYPDNLMFESDFPHATCLTPGPPGFVGSARDVIESSLIDVPEEIQRKVLHDNAARVYRVDGAG